MYKKKKMCWGKSLIYEKNYYILPYHQNTALHKSQVNLLTCILKCPVSPFSISDNSGHLLISSISCLWDVLSRFEGVSILS